MKKSLSLLIFSVFFSLNLSAQSIDKITLKIDYNTTLRVDMETEKPIQEAQILEIGEKTSRYYSVKNQEREEMIDSVENIPNRDKYALLDFLIVTPNKSKERYWIYKNYPEEGKLTYIYNIELHYIYEEEMPQIEWELQEGDSVILEHACKKAVGKFRGRIWTVWYASDIPISDGPWKLCGLPGLILHAKDSKGDFSFECVGIRNGNGEEMKLLKRKYERCTPKQFHKRYVRYKTNFENYVYTTMEVSPMSIPAKYRNPKDVTPCLIEYYE